MPKTVATLTEELIIANIEDDTEYIKACGLTDQPIVSMRWRIAHESIKENLK